VTRSRDARFAAIRFLLAATALFPAAITTSSIARAADDAAAHPHTIRLRAWRVPNDFDIGPIAQAERQMIDTFRQRYPWIDPVNTTGLRLPGDRTMDMVPFMQIAGDIAPDVMYVTFRHSHTYIQKNLLYPLDEYVEAEAEARLRDGSALSNEQYVLELRKGPGWDRIGQRVPELLWQVIRRQCPAGDNCTYRRQRGLSPHASHRHVWAYPMAPLVMAMSYRRPLLSEYGLEQRAPRDWDEMLRWAKLMTNPEKRHYGLDLALANPAWHFLSLLYSAGGRVVQQQEDGNWKCVLDSEAAVEAAYFYARLRLEPVVKNGKSYEGVAVPAGTSSSGDVEYGMSFLYLDTRFVRAAEDRTIGFGPLPQGPGGQRGAEFNSEMCGIFAGLHDDPRRRDAAWKYIAFFDGIDARRIRTENLVQAGLGEFVRPQLLRMFNENGRYNDVLSAIPEDLERTYAIALESGVPEPYGKNCQYLYDQMNRPLGEIINNSDVRLAVKTSNPALGKDAIRRILRDSTLRINQGMLENLPPQAVKRRNVIAWVVVVAVVVIFGWMLRRVLRTFRSPEQTGHGAWQFARYRWAYLMMAPAIGTIALWMYWPLAQGSVIAFQDYSVVGASRWVGAANFADVLFDPEFWYSLRVSLIYALLFLIFGFWAPIGLAFLLQEVPRGKVLFRTIYYLPAILSGAVVIFLWQSFYGAEGMINQVLNAGVAAVNYLFNSQIAEFRGNWLDNPRMALFFCLLPTVWAGMGPGCLIYLAALKTVPEELYESADMDGAGIWRKLFSIALPSIRTLVVINFIGAMIGAVRGSGLILAMTGGGPYSAAGGATEVIGLKLFYTTFGYLQFGVGAAMAWVLGAMLIGFTVLQLQRLSRMEFRAAAATERGQ
jgi:multiple sugar transport system permease protein